MELSNNTPFRAGFASARLRPRRDVLTIVVKGTFALVPGAAVVPVAETAQQHLSGDRFFGGDRYIAGDLSASALYDTDFAPFKPKGEILVLGSCHTPRAEPRALVTALLEAGSVRKQLAISGDRYWRSGPAGLRATEAVPFHTMPLVAERAFGGPGFAENPAGRGIAKIPVGGALAVALPNIEDPSRLVTKPEDRPAPAGFGPLHRLWAPRSSPRGTFDDVWLKAGGFPGLPADFDLTYFQAAPPDQRVDGYFRGDEGVSLGNLHPDLPHVATRLPGLRVRCFLRQSPAFGPAFREVQVQLDTIWIDTEARQLLCLWRGIAEVRSRRFEELERLLVVTEPLSEKALPRDHYQADHAFAAPSPAEQGSSPLGPDVPLDARGFGAPSPGGEPGGADAEIAAGLDEAHKLLEKANVPADIRAKVRGVRDPDQFLAILLAQLKHDPTAAERLQGETEARLKSLVAAHAEDPAAADAVDLSADEDEAQEKPRGAWTRSEVAAHAAAKGSFARQDLRDLDLSHLDLSGLDFTEARLTKASLEQANLDGANLTRARMERADLRRASLRGAVAASAELFASHLQGAQLKGAFFGEAGLREADLGGADLDGADFTKAALAGARLDRTSLRGTVFEGANLTGAILSEARGESTVFLKADLTDCDARRAVLLRGDLVRATLDRARFAGASLKECALFGSHGQGISMTGADLTEARSGDGAAWPGADLRDVKANASVWNDTDLTSASFRGAELVRATFTGARADRAVFYRAVLKHADLSQATLNGASLAEANLFQARLEGADLTDADLSRANLYGCEVLDATLVRTKLDGANLKSTKLAG